MSEVKKQFISTINEHKMLSNKDRVIVAVSGGADSIALLNLLNEIKNEYKLELHVAHVNHKLRGSDADADQEYVRNLAEKMELPITVESFNVGSFAKRNKMGFEEAARLIRYDFFERLSLDIKANKIALGHNADDNIETFLMRLVRGAGTTGLCGIPPIRDQIVRPMIMLWRRDIEKYCASVKLVPRIDYTNYESRYLRNRVRMKLIPQLKLFNPQIKDILLQTILLVTNDSYFVKDRVKEAFDRVVIDRDENTIVLDSKKLKECDLVIQNHLVRLAIEHIKGNLEGVYFVHVEQIIKSLFKSERQEFDLPQGLQVVSGRDHLSFNKEKVKIEAKSFKYDFDIPGEMIIPESGMKIKAEIVNLTGTQSIKVYSPYEALVDCEKINGKLIVRSRHNGDRFSPVGLGGSKKLQDLFVDHKIPQEQRDKVPIIENSNKIVWVVGFRIDEAFKVNSDSRKMLKLSVEENN